MKYFCHNNIFYKTIFDKYTDIFYYFYYYLIFFIFSICSNHNTLNYLKKIIKNIQYKSI